MTAADNETVGKAARARAYAQHQARRELIAAHPDEYQRYYREHCTRIFAERGLGVPEFKDPVL